MSVWEKKSRILEELEEFALVVLVLILVMESLSSYLGRNGSASVSLTMVTVCVQARRDLYDRLSVLKGPC